MVCALLSASGCASARRPVPAQWQVAGHSVDGRPIDVLHCGALGGVLVVGGTHGDEPAGAALVRELAMRLPCPAGDTLTVVPALNPDGLGMAERTNARGVDLNRNLPTWNWTPLPEHGPEPTSEPESRALYALLLAVRPAFVVSIHQGRVSLVDWDGPADGAARALGACTGLAAQRIGAMPGSLGSLLGVDWGWPIVTLELPRDASALPIETLWAAYGDCLVAAIIGTDQR
jgi:protein MpaA